MDASWTHIAKWKKPVWKHCVLCDSKSLDSLISTFFDFSYFLASSVILQDIFTIYSEFNFLMQVK